MSSLFLHGSAQDGMPQDEIESGSAFEESYGTRQQSGAAVTDVGGGGGSLAERRQWQRALQVLKYIRKPGAITRRS